MIEINRIISNNHIYIISITFARLTYFQTIDDIHSLTHKKYGKFIQRRKQANAFTSGVEASFETYGCITEYKRDCCARRKTDYDAQRK